MPRSDSVRKVDDEQREPRSEDEQERRHHCPLANDPVRELVDVRPHLRANLLDVPYESFAFAVDVRDHGHSLSRQVGQRLHALLVHGIERSDALGLPDC